MVSVIDSQMDSVSLMPIRYTCQHSVTVIVVILLVDNRTILLVVLELGFMLN